MDEKNVILAENKEEESIRRKVYNELLSYDILEACLIGKPKYRRKVFLDIYYPLEDARCMNIADKYLDTLFVKELEIFERTHKDKSEDEKDIDAVEKFARHKHKYFEDPYGEVINAVKVFAQFGKMPDFFSSEDAKLTCSKISELCSKMVKTSSYIEALEITMQIEKAVTPIFGLTFLIKNY